MQCPSCGQAFLHPVKTEGVSVDACYECNGIWTQESDLSQLVEGELSYSAPKGTNNRNCARDGTELDRVFLRGAGSAAEVELDVCSSCRGVWFDSGELRQVGEIQAAIMERYAGKVEGWDKRDRRMRLLSQLYGIDNPISQRPQKANAKFISRVYQLVALGIAIMAFSMVGWGYVLTRVSFGLAIGLFFLAFVGEIIIILTLFAMRRNRRSQLFLYLLFTVFTGATAGPLPVLMFSIGMLPVVLAVFVLTAGIFFALSFFVLVTKANLEHWGNYLLPFLIILIVGDLIIFILAVTGALGTASYFGLVLASSIFGAILFGGFILYDTSRLLHKARPGDEVLMATELFLDFVNLFIELLRIAFIVAALAGDST